MRTPSLFLALALPLATGFLGCSSPPPPADVLTADAYVEAPYPDVWRRFTEAGAFADWFSAPCLAFGTLPGEEVVWGTPERELYRGRLTRYEPGRGLGFTFRFVGFDFDERETPVEVTLVRRGPTVLVRLRHDVTGAPRTKEVITDLGWQKSLSRLKTLLETGRPMAWPEEPER